jgi:catechol 2,3-dioxygenase-like lactoylglutathione lyase family enzyme
MLQSSPVVAFIGATDLEAARDFYGGTLGLTVEEIGHFACVFRTGECTIRVTRVPDLRPQTFTVLGWDVSDIRAVIAALVRDGVQFRRYDGIEQDDDGIWMTPGGDLVAWFTDPDGNVLSLTQAARA